MQKWYPKSDQNGLQKGPKKVSQITKMSSKSHPKSGLNKSIKKQWFSAPPHPSGSSSGCSESSIFTFWSDVSLAPFWVSFWRCFGSPNGGQGHQKAISKKQQQKWCPKWSQTGPKGGPEMEPKSSKMMSWKHLVSRVAPKWPPEPLQDRFWKGFGTTLGAFSSVVLTYVWWFRFACILSQHVANAQHHNESSKECSRELPRNSFSLRAILHWKVH